MTRFEPSTWAEVEEAIATHRASTQISDPFVKQVRAFSDAPERFLTSPIRATVGPTPGLGVLPDSVNGRDRSSSHVETIPSQKSTSNPQSDDSPSRELDSAPPAAAAAVIAPAARPPVAVWRAPDQFDDLLGMGRVDIETEEFVRRYSAAPNVHESTMFPVPSHVPKLRESHVNPSSECFDASFYMARVHKLSTAEQLRQGKNILHQLQDRLDQLTEQVRREKFVDAALVEAAFENTKQIMKPLSPFAKGKEFADENIFRDAEKVMRERYEGIMGREEKLSRLSKAAAIYKRYTWIFALGSKLRRSADGEISNMEETVREYLRGKKWLEVQERTDVSIIKNDMDRGFNYLIDCIVSRLSNDKLSRQQISRSIHLLSSVKKEELLAKALTSRMRFAEENLRKVARSIDVSKKINIRDGTTSEGYINNLSAKTSRSFYESLTHYWRLGKVLMAQEKWSTIVKENVRTLCNLYVKILRENLLIFVELLSREAIQPVALVRRKAAVELGIPYHCRASLEQVGTEIVNRFATSISKAVRSGAIYIAEKAVQSNSIGIQSAQLLVATTVDALQEVDNPFLRETYDDDKQLQTFTTPRRTSGIKESNPHDAKKEAEKESCLDQAALSCAEAPSIFARQIYDSMQGMDCGEENISLQLSVCYAELLSATSESILDKMKKSSSFSRSIFTNRVEQSLEAIQNIQDEVVGTYVTIMSHPLQTLASGLVTFPEDELGNLVARSIPIKIEGVSSDANELALQLALVMITTRQRSSNKVLLRQILLKLISAIGTSLVNALSSDKLAYHRAAQLWVDVTYVQEMVTRGAGAGARALQSAMDGFSRVKERAVQAVLADGYSFSLTDMKVLRETVVAKGVEEVKIVSDCFHEAWRFLGSDDEDEEDDGVGEGDSILNDVHTGKSLAK